MYKKELSITGTPVGKISPGERALILENGCARLTTAVVAVEELSPFELRFETQNTFYTLHIPPRKIELSDTTQFALCGAERE